MTQRNGLWTTATSVCLSHLLALALTTGMVYLLATYASVAADPLTQSAVVEHTARADISYTFRRWVAVHNRVDIALTGYPLEVTSAGGEGFDHAALVSAGKSRPDGYDLRVLVDGIDVDRWVAYPNTDHTKVWVNHDLGEPVTCSLTASYEEHDSLSSLEADGLAGFPAAGTVYNSSSEEAFVYSSRDAISLLGLTRGERGTTPAAGNIGDTLVLVEHDIWLAYGDATASEPTVDNSYRPAFEIVSSTNVIWRYDFFGDDEGHRPGAWAWDYSTGGFTQHYTLNHRDEPYYTNPWEEILLMFFPFFIDIFPNPSVLGWFV